MFQCGMFEVDTMFQAEVLGSLASENTCITSVSTSDFPLFGGVVTYCLMHSWEQLYDTIV